MGGPTRRRTIPRTLATLLAACTATTTPLTTLIPHVAHATALSTRPRGVRVRPVRWRVDCELAMTALQWADGFRAIPRPAGMPDPVHAIALHYGPTREVWGCIESGGRAWMIMAPAATVRRGSPRVLRTVTAAVERAVQRLAHETTPRRARGAAGGAREGAHDAPRTGAPDGALSRQHGS